MLKICAEKGTDYAVKVHGVEISPNPVVKGKLANFNISAAAGNLTLFPSFLILCLSDVEVDPK